MRNDYLPDEALRKRALELLGRRARSRQEIIEKLAAKGADRAEAEAVADWLVEMRLLNDADYAEQIVRYYGERGYGRKRIERELWWRGIEKDLWDTALEDLPERDDKMDDFIRQRLRGELPDRQEERRLVNALVHRGFNRDEIGEGLRRYRESLEEE